MMPMDPTAIVIALVGFLVSLTLYLKMRKWRKKYYESIKPPPPKHKLLTDAEKHHQLRMKILARDGFKCQECGFKYHLEVHHIIPRSKGGTDDPDNLITLCKKCHDNHHPDRHPQRQKIYRKSKHRKHKHRHSFNRNNCSVEKIETIDESDFLEPIGKISSPERRDALYKKWMNDELNQT